MSVDAARDAAISIASALYDSRPDRRKAALERLEALYVSCEGGRCRTSPEVARWVIPHARLALSDRDPEVRVTGARAIELLATDSEELVPELARALGDTVEAVRLAVLDALCEFGEAASLAAPQVTERLIAAPGTAERCAAADCLGNADVEMNSVDALLRALVNDVPEVQACAAHALGRALESDRSERRLCVSHRLRSRLQWRLDE